MKVINLGTPLRAAEIIDELGKKRLAYADVRFQNVHLKKINDLIGRRVFTKNDLFMDAGGLWDILQEEDGTIGRYHHHHGLSPTFIISALSSLQDPELVILECQTHRYIVVTLSVDGKAVLAVIETDAPLRNNRNANINKLVTLYEKNDFPDYLRRIKNGPKPAFYTKNREPNGAPIASLGFSTKNIRQTLLIVKTVESPDLASE